MKDDKSELDKLEDAVDKVLAPERAVRWGVRILVAIITLGACYGVGRVVWHMVGKVDKAVDAVEQEEAQEARQAQERELQESLDHNWFVIKKDEIDAATLAVGHAREALSQHQEIAANRGLLDFKGKEDRQTAARLQGGIVQAQAARLVLIRQYNQMAARVGPAVLGELPLHIEVAEVPEPTEEGE